MPLININGVQKQSIVDFSNDIRIVLKKIPSCVLCGETNFTLISEKDRYGIPLNTAVCDNCGIIFSLDQMTQKSLVIFYSEYYRKIYDGKDNINFQELEKKYKFHYDNVKLISFINKTKTAAELGCGGGWNLMPFMRENIDHYGFDYDEDYIEYGKKKNLNLYKGGLETAVKMNVKTDYLLLSHILEHTDNPLKFLTDIKQILKSKAVININIPSRNLLLFGGGGTGSDLLGTLQNAHNYLFDSYTIKRLALSAGYKILANIGGGNIILQNIDAENFNKKNYYANQKIGRGKKIIKSLKFVEFIYPLKKKIPVSQKLWHNIFRLVYLKNTLKKIFLFRFKK